MMDHWQRLLNISPLFTVITFLVSVNHSLDHCFITQLLDLICRSSTDCSWYWRVWSCNHKPHFWPEDVHQINLCSTSWSTIKLELESSEQIILIQLLHSLLLLMTSNSKLRIHQIIWWFGQSFALFMSTMSTMLLIVSLNVSFPHYLEILTKNYYNSPLLSDNLETKTLFASTPFN